MAYEGAQTNLVGVTAAADLSTHQYKLVKMSSTGIALNTTSGGICHGVLQNKPNALGQPATVTFVGVSKVKAGAAVAKGAEFMSNATGLAITATSTNRALGVVLEAATAANDIITVALYGGAYVVA